MFRIVIYSQQDIADVVYTIRDVVDEIKDQNTKQRLRVLPYEIKMVEPSPESLLKGDIYQTQKCVNTIC
jgi:hypothetical protein